MVIVCVGDQNVLEAVVVEVDNDRIASLLVGSVRVLVIDPNLFGDVLELAATVVDVKRVPSASDEKQVDVSISIQILGCDTAAREGGWGLGALSAQFVEPIRGSVGEVDSARDRHIAEKEIA